MKLHVRISRLGNLLFTEKSTVSVAHTTLSICSAGGLDQTGTGLVSPVDLRIVTDAETMEHYLHETEEYHNEGRSGLSARPPHLAERGTRLRYTPRRQKGAIHHAGSLCEDSHDWPVPIAPHL